MYSGRQAIGSRAYELMPLSSIVFPQVCIRLTVDLVIKGTSNNC